MWRYRANRFMSVRTWLYDELLARLTWRVSFVLCTSPVNQTSPFHIIRPWVCIYCVSLVWLLTLWHCFQEYIQYNTFCLVHKLLRNNIPWRQESTHGPMRSVTHANCSNWDFLNLVCIIISSLRKSMIYDLLERLNFFQVILKDLYGSLNKKTF